MLGSMSDVLRAKFENQESAVEILDSLQEIFRQKNEQACIEITGKYTTTRIYASEGPRHNDEELLHRGRTSWGRD